MFHKFSIAILLLPVIGVKSAVLFVDKEPENSESSDSLGSSWENPYINLQDALEAHQRKRSAPGAHPGGAAPPAQHDAPHAASASAGVDVVDRTELDRRKWKLEEKLLRSELEDALAVPRQLKAEVERLDRARQDDARRSEDAALCHRHELEAAQLEVRRVRAEYDGALETLGEQEERMDDLRSQVQALQGLYREHVDQKYQA